MQFVRQTASALKQFGSRFPRPIFAVNTVNCVQNYSNKENGNVFTFDKSTIIQALSDALSCSLNDACELYRSPDIRAHGPAYLSQQIIFLQAHGVSSASIMKHPLLLVAPRGKCCLLGHYSLHCVIISDHSVLISI